VFEGLNIASIEDIAAMKLIAISMRGARRDFVDFYYLLNRLSFSQTIGFALKKYPHYQQMVLLKGLTYFDDAQDEDLARGIKILDKDFSWEEAKKKIMSEVSDYQLKLLKS
jgi:predicted nucleotidyltransferase component of viral defense system